MVSLRDTGGENEGDGDSTPPTPPQGWRFPWTQPSQHLRLWSPSEADALEWRQPRFLRQCVGSDGTETAVTLLTPS